MTLPAAVLLSAAAVAAVVDWVAVSRGRSRLEYVAKPLTMLLLIGVGATVDAVAPTRQVWFLAAGVLCLAGDVFLMLPRDRFVPGLVAFLGGHLCYTAGFASTGRADAVAAIVGVAVVGAAVVGVGRPVLRAVRRDHAPLLAPVVVYLVAISTMVVVAFAIGPWLAAVGAVLFYASDSVIAWQRFVRPRPWAPVTIMVTYHLAQAALIGSLATRS